MLPKQGTFFFLLNHHRHRNWVVLQMYRYSGCSDKNLFNDTPPLTSLLQRRNNKMGRKYVYPPYVIPGI